MNQRITMLKSSRVSQARFGVRRLDAAFGPILISIFFTLLSAPCLAADPATISPDQIVQATLAHSPQLQMAANEVAVMDARYHQATANALPSLQLQASATRYDGLENLNLGPSMQVPAVEDRYSVSVGISQTIFAGGRIANSISATKLDRMASLETRKAAESDLRFRALTTYWTWAKSFYSRNALRSSVQRIEAHNADMANFKKSGLATENDALSSDVQLEQTRLKLENANRALQIAAAHLTFLTGMTLPSNAIPEKPVIPALVMSPARTAASSVAITNRPETRAAQYTASSLKKRANMERAGWMPQVQLVGRYERANPNQLFFPPEDEWNSDTFFGVIASWNLFEGGLTSARIAESSARSAAAQWNVRLTEDVVSLEVQEACIHLESAQARVTVSRRAESSARKNLESATNLWKSGLNRHSDVLDAEAKLAECECDTISAEADAVLAKAGLERAMGSP